MELWDKGEIFKIVSIAGSLFFDEWMEDYSRKGFSRIYVLMDVGKGVYLETNIWVKGSTC